MAALPNHSLTLPWHLTQNHGTSTINTSEPKIIIFVIKKKYIKVAIIKGYTDEKVMIKIGRSKSEFEGHSEDFSVLSGRKTILDDLLDL